MKTKLLFMLLVLVIVSCDKKEDLCPDNDSFCSIVETGDYNELRELTDDFMAPLSGDRPAQLEQVKDWLACKSCVEKAEILCNSCIETFPEQSEIQIDFLSNGQQETKTLDLIMNEPMTFGGFH